MGREIRRVPKGWEHPKNDRGHYQPLYDHDYKTAAEDWLTGLDHWQAGKNDNRGKFGDYWWEYAGNPPDEEYCRDTWTKVETTHYQIYETVSEGTPISPIFETLDELTEWLIKQGYSEEAAKGFAKDGWCMSGMFSPQTGFVSDIETCATRKEE